ncbi:glycosyltransferase family 2 protein [Flavobacterium sp. GB2R13]|uniref:glycosyltransferase family 2 protein n=1 Tax=Flavobacterium algoris TaxID=3398733 RepID=UPI003A86C6D1
MKLTIITINYNNLEGLKRTVESVVNQSWQEFEYIIIDGGSTDGSAAYIENQNDKIDYWVSEPDSGIYNAMNKGILKATGEYLLFLNSGDLLFSNTVLEENEAEFHTEDLICFDILMRGTGTEFIKSSRSSSILPYLYLDTFPHQSILIRKKIFYVIGFYDEKLKIVADWKFVLQAIVFYNASYKNIGRLLSIYYLDGISSIQSNHLLMINERHAVLNTDFPYLKEFFVENLKKEKIIKDLRNSNKIKVLIKLGLLNRF